MPRRTKEEAAQTRDRLLKAALNVFSQKGFALATLEDVASEAGLTRGAVYWHFGSKADLYTALLDQYADLSSGIVQAAAAEGGTLVEILRRVFIRLLEAVETTPDLRAMMEISLFKSERLPELQTAFTQRMESSRALVDSIAVVMRQGIATGELRAGIEPEAMARAFLATQQGLVYHWLQDPHIYSLKDQAPVFADLFFEGIKPV